MEIISSEFKDIDTNSRQQLNKTELFVAMESALPYGTIRDGKGPKGSRKDIRIYHIDAVELLMEAAAVLRKCDAKGMYGTRETWLA